MKFFNEKELNKYLGKNVAYMRGIVDICNDKHLMVYFKEYMCRSQSPPQKQILTKIGKKKWLTAAPAVSDL